MQSMYYVGLDVHKKTISYCVRYSLTLEAAQEFGSAVLGSKCSSVFAVKSVPRLFLRSFTGVLAVFRVVGRR
jgi:hypothetical protein